MSASLTSLPNKPRETRSEIHELATPQALLTPLRYQPLVICLLAMAAGILLDHWLSLAVLVYISVSLAALVGWWHLYRAKAPLISRDSDYREAASSCCLLLAISGVTAGWHHVRWNWYRGDDIGFFASDASQPICLEGTLISEPRWQSPSDSKDGFNYKQGDVSTRLTLRAQQIRDRDQWRPVSGRIDVITDGRIVDVQVGDRIQVFGKLTAFSVPSNPGQFDFAWYYRAQRKLAVVTSLAPECVQVVQSASWSLHLLPMLRRELNEVLWRYISPDEAAFASAIMLGNREQLSTDRRDQFLKTGTAHLLAISGLHVGILASIFYLFYRLGILNRRRCLWVIIGFVIFYAWLVEFRPPATRAAILIGTYCAGRLWGEASFSLNLLALAGIVVLVISPFDLFNLGAQLSFLAVATLCLTKDLLTIQPPSDPLDRLIASKRPFVIHMMFGLGRLIRSAYLVSIIVWLVAMPLVAHHFHVVAPIGLLINPLLLLPLTLALYAGLMVLVTGWVFPPIATLAGWFCQWNLKWVEDIVNGSERLDFSHFSTPGPTWIGLAVFYLGLTLICMISVSRQRIRWATVFIVGWCFIGWWFPDRLVEQYRKLVPRPLICTFIDVGHGTGVLLQMPDGKNILYDGGSFGSASYGYQSISSVLWSERISQLDTVVISHADLDHYNALPELSRRFRFGEVVMTRQTLTSTSPSLNRLFDQLQSQGVPLRTVYARDPPIVDDPKNQVADGIRILSPPREGTGGNDNSDSLVLVVEHHGQRILLTGDLEGPGLEALLATDPLPAGLIMAPHHGSFNSDPSEFVKWSSPRIVVISGARQRIRPAAVEVYQQQQRSVFRTDVDGAIRYIVHPKKQKVMTWHQRRWQVELVQASDLAN